MSTEGQLPASAVRMYKNTTRSADEQGVYASARWKVRYDELDRFFEVAGGLPEPTGWGSRIVPLKFPDTDAAKLYACAIRCEASGVDPATAMHMWAFCDVDFKTFKYEFEGDTAFITEKYNTAAETITVPGSAFRFPSDGRLVNQEVGVLVPGTEFELTFHRLPRLDFALYQSMEGRVNSEVFVPGYYATPPGYVQCLGAAASVVNTVGGVRSFDATLKFRYRYIKINEIMRGDGAGFEAPLDAVGNGIYPEADLNLLFQ